MGDRVVCGERLEEVEAGLVMGKGTMERTGRWVCLCMQLKNGCARGISEAC